MSREFVPGPPSFETVGPLSAAAWRGAYQEAWQEWEATGEERSWDAAIADGLSSWCGAALVAASGGRQ